MENINSKSGLFEGKQRFDYNSHHSMPKINYKRRRVKYQGIINQPPPELIMKQIVFK